MKILNFMVNVGKTSLITFRLLNASIVASQAATHSASAVESATIGCFLLNQAIAPLASVKTNPLVLFRSPISEAQSLSQYPWMIIGGSMRVSRLYLMS